MRPRCEGFDGLTTGMDVRAITTEAPGQGKAFGHPVNRFTRVLVPESAACPGLTEDAGCADTWVVTLQEL